MTEGGYDKRKNYFMNIIVRAYNEGVAFRYHFPETTNGLFLHITGERTSFTMHRRCSRGVSYRRLHHRIYRQLPESENNDKEDSLQIITCIEISFL